MTDYRDLTGFMANLNRGLGIGDPMIAAARTAGNIFANPSSGLDFHSIADQYRAQLLAQRQLGDSYAADNPQAAYLARGLGMATISPTGEAANLAARLPVPAMIGLGRTAAAASSARPNPNLFAPAPGPLQNWRVRSSDGHEVLVHAPDYATARDYASGRMADELVTVGNAR